MAEKRNIILFGALIVLTISYWLSSTFFIADKPFEMGAFGGQAQLCAALVVVVACAVVAAAATAAQRQGRACG